jgi:hypothetical protein
MTLLLLPALLWQVGSQGAPAANTDVVAELVRLRVQVASLELALGARAKAIDELQGELRSVRGDVGRLAERDTEPMAGPFLAAPPNGSDSAGVAKVAVFAPRLRIESSSFHDVLSVRVRRMEATSVRTVGETDIPRDGSAVDLPLDRNGALYVVEWSTSEGHNFSLLLVDATSGQTAATVQVRPNMTQGRFLFVGYRTE